MEGYLGATKLDSYDNTPYAGYGPLEWALTYIKHYGQIDGGHHKQWVLDQIARIIHGTPVELSVAKWMNGHIEYRFRTGKPSEEYREWVQDMKGYNPDTDEYTYDYDEGTAP